MISVAIADVEDVAQQLQQRKVRNGFPVRGTMGCVDTDTARATALDELVAEAALPHPGFGHYPHHLAPPPSSISSSALDVVPQDRLQPLGLSATPSSTSAAIPASPAATNRSIVLGSFLISPRAKL